MRLDLIARAKPIVEAALAAPPGERQQKLRSLSAGDSELQCAAERVVADLEVRSGLLTKPVPEALGELESPLAGRRVGSYVLRREIGRGGHGTVYLAERADDLFEQQVAVKLLPAPDDGSPRRRRFERELQILAGMEHPSVVRLLDGGLTQDGFAYLVMELVEGLPLEQHCRSRGLGIQEKVRLIVEVCEAVAHAHGKGVLHRDLKPGKVLVDSAGRVKLLDFGVAKLLRSEGDTGATTILEPPGLTWFYASPEQIDGVSGLTTAVDQHALGVMLYELLAGRRPWRDRENSIVRYCQAVAEADPPSISWFKPGIDRDLEAIVLKALERHPQSRYASVDDFRRDLERYLDGGVVAARPAPFWRPLWRACRRRKPAVVLALTVLALSGAYGMSWVEAVRAARTQQERDFAQESVQRAMYFVSAVPFAVESAAFEALTTALEALEKVERQPHLSKLDALMFADFSSQVAIWAGHPSATALGELDLSTRLLRLSLALAGKGDPSWPEDESLIYRMSLSQSALADQLMETGQYAEAGVILTEALQSAERAVRTPELSARRADEWRRRRSLIRAEISRVYLRQGRRAEALAHRGLAVGEAEAIFHADPHVEDHRRTLAGLKASLGWALRVTGDLGAALREYDEARELMRDSLRPDRMHGSDTSLAARGLHEEGRILLEQGLTVEAARRLDQAIEVFRRLREAMPLSPMVDRTLMRALARRAEAGVILRLPSEQIQAAAAEAVDLTRLVLESNPGNERVREEVEEVHAALSRAGLR